MAHQYSRYDNVFPDASNQEAVMNKEKFDFCESSTTDSGILSGGNIQYSGEIVSEEFKEDNKPFSDSGVLDNSMKTDESREMFLRMDSGVDLGITESLSSLSIRNPDLNDLSSSNPKPTTQISEITKPTEQPPWELFYVQDEDGNTQLHIVIEQDFQDLAKTLIQQVPHPRLLDTPNDYSESPLHLAVKRGQWSIARLLIVAGARPCLRDLNGDSPLHLCAQSGDVRCLKAIADPISSIERDSLGLKYPPQTYEPCNFDQWNYHGETCLHVAATYGHLDIVRHLVWYGADINAREGCQGYTALHFALAKSHEQMASFLLSEKKLNPTILTYGQRSVLQLGFSVSSNLAEILRLRGVASPYSSDEDEYDDDSEDELYENTNHYQSSIIHASA